MRPWPFPILTREIHVGDVFPTKGTGPKGRKYGTRYWLVIALNPTQQAVHLLGLDAAGNVVSTTSYGYWVLQCRPRLARIKCVEPFLRQLRGEDFPNPSTQGELREH